MKGPRATKQRNWDLSPGSSDFRFLTFTQVGAPASSRHGISSCPSRRQPSTQQSCWLQSHLPPRPRGLQDPALEPRHRPQPTCGQTPGRHPEAS